MYFEGRAFRYGRDVDTDVIIPARYLNTSDPAALAAHAMEDLDPTFAASVTPGDLIVADENFGCGSSREHAPVALKAAGVSCVIAKSFARIFYRNAINMGLPILECPPAVDAIAHGQTVAVDTDKGLIRNLDTGESFSAEPFPPFLVEIIDAGGLVERTRRKMATAPAATAPAADNPGADNPAAS
ncbi:MAG: 3-isopropylmalate dehydratase small subunit [Atopobiaceae bacterium]|jgi:3-isopropylmalate/(R)-2-methylmalate dehydratase small subunit|uniref:3-isopropylmalate dehydratase small subunit n=1 Tax=Muricaecibacterium torontonense TaxID=3032871 RepID=A0A4S2F4D9_9ACTN|nr:3-isopropylmalate dehydratase small subunit [Muricaecibacterium torontonense]MCI8676640.1 3-isopropylmalate dehydratase small subunit [Atopobiaceae bacterium]TGY62473.1 3-isopropylmalate dehydratase small subunit [Muricaecibacterium torontonense]